MKKLNKTKKLLALLCSMLLVLSVAIPVAAATAENGNLKITVTGDEQTTVSAYQVLEFDNGWVLTDWAKTALGANADAALVALTDENNSNSSAIAGYLTTLAKATGKVQAATATGTGEVVLNTTELGSYLVICKSDNWTYTNMLVSNYDSTGTGNDTLKVGTATAKGTHKNIIDEKTVASGDEYVAVGDVIDYTVKGTFPYFQGYDKPVFTITDSMSANLKAVTTGVAGAWTAADITITVNGNKLTMGATGAYTVATKDSGFEISFNQEWLKANAATYAGEDFTVTYQGVVTAYSAGGYTNTVSSTVTTHDGDDGEPDPDPGDPVDVTSYTAAIELKKTDEDGANVLEGAVFVLKESNSGKYIKLTDDDVELVEKDEATEFTTDEDGTVKIEGLDPDFTYVLEETQAPSGYQLEKTLPTVAFVKVNDAEGNATGTYKATLTGGSESAWLNGNASSANATIEITLKDSKMGALPETGGVGVIILTVIGAAMMAVFGGTLVVMKKKE